MTQHNSPNWLSSIQLVLWDLDGTLYPSPDKLSDTIHQLVVEKMAQHLALPFMKAEEVFEKKRQELKSNTKTLEFFGLPGQDTFSAFWESLNWSDYIQPNPRLVSLFQQSTLPHGIITNSNARPHIARKLECVGLEMAFFSPVVTSAETGFHKPDPQAFQAALQQTSIPTHSILYVGDRVEVDIVGAHRVGMKTCLVGSVSPLADLSLPTAEALLQQLNAQLG